MPAKRNSWRLPPPPEGVELVDRHQAAAYFGISPGQWCTWERTGRASIPRYARKNTNGTPTLLYAAADLEHLREDLKKHDVFPEGLVSRHAAAELFDVSLTTWTVWERDGRIPLRRYSKKIGRGRPWVLYAMADLLPLREEFRKLEEPYADPRHPEVYRVPIRSREHRHEMEAIIDAADLPTVQGRAWNWRPADKYHTGEVVLSTMTGPMTPLKRLILGLEDGGPEHRISHANGDALDCRRTNLVLETIEQQVRRTRKMGSVSGRKYTSEYKGVSWDEPRGMWKVQLTYGGANRFSARCYEEVEAAHVYDEAARKYCGEDASLNFPYPGEKPARLAA